MSRLNILDAIRLVEDSASSIFLKDDVLKLLDNIDADIPSDPIAPQFTASETDNEETVTLTREELEDFAQSVADEVAAKIEDECTAWIDNVGRDADVDFSLEGDRIVVDGIMFNSQPDMRINPSLYDGHIDELFDRKNSK